MTILSKTLFLTKWDLGLSRWGDFSDNERALVRDGDLRDRYLIVPELDLGIVEQLSKRSGNTASCLKTKSGEYMLPAKVLWADWCDRSKVKNWRCCKRLSNSFD